MALDPIGVIFMAKDLASATIGNLERQFMGLDKTVQATAKTFQQGVVVMGQGIAVMGAGAAALAPLALGVKHAVTFQTELTKLGNIAGIEGAKLVGLGDQARTMAAAMGFAPTEVVKGMQDLASSGFSALESLELVDKAMLFSAASQGALNVEHAAATMTGAMRGFGFHVHESSKVVDMMTAATNATSLRFDELALTLGNTAADANLANQSFGSTLAMLGALRDTGLTSLRSSEKLRIALQHMMDPKAEQMATSLGVAMRGPEGKMREIVDVVADLQPALGKLGQRQQEAAISTIFGKEAMAVYNAVVKSTFTTLEDGVEVVKSGTDSIKAMTKTINDSQGSTQKQFEKTRETFMGAWDSMKASISSILLSVGLPFLNFITAVGVGVAKIAMEIAKFSAAHPGMMKMVAGVIAFTGSFVFLTGMVIFFKGAMMALSGVLAVVGLTVAGLTTMFLQAAVVIAVLAGAAYVVYLAFKTNFGGITTFFSDLWNKVQLFIRGVVGLIADGQISKELNDQLDAAGVGEYVDIVMRLFTKAKYFVMGVWQGMGEGVKAFEPFGKLFVNAVKGMFEIFGELVKGVMKGLNIMTGGTGDQANSLKILADVGRLVGTTLGLIFGTIGTAIGAVIAGVSGLVSLFMILIEGAGKVAGALAFIGVSMFEGNTIEALKIVWTDFAEWFGGMWMKIGETLKMFWQDLVGSLMGFVGNLPFVGAIAEKLGIPLPKAGGQTSEVEASGAKQGALEVPTAGFGNAALATNAQVIASQGTTAATKEAAESGTARPITLVTPVNIDGRQVAEVVNTHNERSRMARGAVR